MRLFTGISVEEESIPGMAELRASARLKWAVPSGLHITTKFIGEWPEPLLHSLETALSRIPFRESITVALTGIEFFARALVVTVDPSPPLVALNQASEDALEDLGCARETRPWRPHVTLARLDGPVPTGLRETIATMNLSSGTFLVRNFHLYLSRPGSLYTKLATYP